MIDKSADGAGVSVSVAVLLPGVGSVVPLGTLTVAVFTRLPVWLEGTDTLIVYVIEPLAGMFTNSLMLPKRGRIRLQAFGNDDGVDRRSQYPWSFLLQSSVGRGVL